MIAAGDVAAIIPTEYLVAGRLPVAIPTKPASGFGIRPIAPHGCERVHHEEIGRIFRPCAG